MPDSVHVEGPLAGVATALSRDKSELTVAVAVDHPFLRTETLRKLVEARAGLPVIPVDDHGTRQVTCGVYPRGLASAAVEEAQEGGSIQSLLDRVSFIPVTPEQWRAWGEDGRSWFSINSPDALEEALSRYQLH